MKKSIWIFLIATVTIVIFAAIHFSANKVIYADQSTYDSIKGMRQEREFCSLKELKINGETAYESEGDSWWLCSLPEDTDFNNLSFSFKQDRFSLKLAVLKQDFSKEAIEQNQEIKLLAYSPRYYREYSLHITTLPIFTLNSLTSFPVEDEQAYFNGMDATVHLRGASTFSYPKRGYKITLSEKASFLGMREDDDWVLYAGYNDQERVRNVFSSNLWYNSCAGNNSFGVNNGYEYRYIELFHNGTYAGLYALGYKPDQKQFEIDDGEYLFKKTQNFEKTQNNEVVFELVGEKTKSNDREAWSTLKSGYLDDVSSVIDFWLFDNLCVAFDNTIKNYYMALKLDGEKYLAVYCPWDLDLTWGNFSNVKAKNYVDVYCFKEDIFIQLADTDMSLLLDNTDSNTIERLKDRYNELRRCKWSDETLEAAIDQYEKRIFDSGAYMRDITRWPESTQMTDPNVKLSHFRNYVFSRIAWMDEMIDNL